jgi:FMN phosphatase YigB (HAD superfamily)
MSVFLPSLPATGPLPRAVIFDVDGTLYDQRKLRVCMLLEMGRILVQFPAKFADLKIVWDFRKIRERNRHQETSLLDAAQYNWGAQASGVSSLRVRQAVQEWLYERPLPYLARCRYGGVKELFDLLRKRGIAIGIFSDYPADAKLKALGLAADAVVAATQPEVSRLKPNPRGLLITATKLDIPKEACLFIGDELITATKLDIPKEACLFIGDEDDKDGECARRAGMPWVILARGKRAPQFLRLQDWVKKCTG